jgi:hypothetical protein
MTHYKRIAIDTSKSVFTVHCTDGQDRPMLRTNLRRGQDSQAPHGATPQLDNKARMRPRCFGYAGLGARTALVSAS